MLAGRKSLVRDLSDSISQIYSQGREENVDLAEQHRPEPAYWGVINTDPVVY